MSRIVTKQTRWHVCPAKTQISLGGCPGWSETSLGAHVSLLVLSWGGSYVLKVWWGVLCTEGEEEQPSPIKLGVPRWDQIAQSARWFALGLAIHHCHAGLSCTSDDYPPVCINWWLSRFPGLRWFHRVFPSYLAARPTLASLHLKTAGPPPFNTHSVKCYAPVICGGDDAGVKTWHLRPAVSPQRYPRPWTLVPGPTLDHFYLACWTCLLTNFLIWCIVDLLLTGK